VTNEQARRLVVRLLSDLSSRKGFEMLDEISENTMDDIVEAHTLGLVRAAKEESWLDDHARRGDELRRDGVTGELYSDGRGLGRREGIVDVYQPRWGHGL